MPKRATITMETGAGTAEAVPNSDAKYDTDWLISHPWGDLRFSGTPAEVRREMVRLVADREAADAGEEGPVGG